MSKLVKGPDGTVHSFPDEATDAMISGALKAIPQTNAPPDTAEKPSAMRRFWTPILPSMTPSDYVKGPMYAARHPIVSAGLIKDAIAADPVGAIPVVGQVKRGFQKLSQGDYAGAAGEAVMAASPLALKGVRAPVGKATSAAGRATEVLASSPAAQYAGGAGAALQMYRGNPLSAAASAILPASLEYLGKGMKKLGELIQGTDPLTAKEVGALRMKLANPKIANNPTAKQAILAAIKTRGGKP